MLYIKKFILYTLYFGDAVIYALRGLGLDLGWHVRCEMETIISYSHLQGRLKE